MKKKKNCQRERERNNILCAGKLSIEWDREL